ncbi:hypothetical protein EV356DRAFT_499292 [Viridothelium virens]|uniref:Uncharacterized protein n=1 Tax=Viridothelium virens TaxID=1048519 RepID=A0A6A6HCH2_VIRVR|nr:hypothetical protein EV356DRAFT_499292 [Viridothelium virens]
MLGHCHPLGRQELCAYELHVLTYSNASMVGTFAMIMAWVRTSAINARHLPRMHCLR